MVRTLVSRWDLIHDSGNRQQALHCELRGTQGGGLLHHCEALPPSTDLSSHNLSLLQGLRCPHSYHVAQAGRKGTTAGGPGVRAEDQGACWSPPSLEQKPAIPNPVPRVALRKKHQCEAWVGGPSEQVVVGSQEDWPRNAKVRRGRQP